MWRGTLHRLWGQHVGLHHLHTCMPRTAQRRRQSGIQAPARPNICRYNPQGSPTLALKFTKNPCQRPATYRNPSRSISIQSIPLSLLCDGDEVAPAPIECQEMDPGTPSRRQETVADEMSHALAHGWEAETDSVRETGSPRVRPRRARIANRPGTGPPVAAEAPGIPPRQSPRTPPGRMTRRRRSPSDPR